jgi:ferredoxin-NADP reductase
MHAVLRKIETLSPQTTSFWFEPLGNFDFIAGQFIELSLSHDNPDTRGIRRWFTISSSPHEALIALTTTRDYPSSTFKHALHELSLGQHVIISEPMGDFVLPKDTHIPITFVAGGIGITPFHSMAKWLIHTNEKRSIRLLYAVRNEEDIVFQDSFQAANIPATIVVSQPAKNWPGLHGKLTADQILEIASAQAPGFIYLAGPEPMVEHLQDTLLELGVDRNQLVVDFFPNYRSIS